MLNLNSTKYNFTVPAITVRAFKMSKIAIEKVINCNEVINATIFINNSTDNKVICRSFVIIADHYALGDDGRIYQVVTKDDIEQCNSIILAFKYNDTFFNYAEDEFYVEGTLDTLKSIVSNFVDVSDDEFESLSKQSNYAYDSDDETATYNRFINIIIDKLCGYGYSFSDLCYLCGMTKKFNDLDTRYNPYYSATEYVPHTMYYFF